MDPATHFQVRGEGPFLLLISGLGGLASFWRNQVDQLAERFTVVSYDQRGMGGSGRSALPCTLEALAADALQLMDRLEADRFSVVGHSTGGAIAQHLTARHPARVDRLVLSASWLRPDPYFRSFFELRRDIAARGDMALFQRLGTFLLYPSSWIAGHRSELAEAERRWSDAQVVAGRIEALLARDGSAMAAHIGCPTLVLCARDDLVAPPQLSQELTQAIDGAHMITFDWGGHYMQHTITGQYNQALLAFL